jgi:choline kinase
VLALGFRRELVDAELDRLDFSPRPTAVLNPHFELGSMLTVHAAAREMTSADEVLLMDADVLYDARIARALVSGAKPVNRLLIDRDFVPGDEPVKVLARSGVPLELRKQPESGIEFDTIGESVGFFRMNRSGARRLADIVAGYVARDAGHLPHEEALRDLIRERIEPVEITDVTGAPWIEIDFPEDVARARDVVLPKLLPLDGAAR